MNHQVVFTDDDIKCIKCPIHLEQTGLIVKHSTGISGEMYQFKHLAFQEYLCSLYLCLTENVNEYITYHELTSCTPTIFGIHHLVRTEYKTFIRRQINNITMIRSFVMNNDKILNYQFFDFEFIEFILMFIRERDWLVDGSQSQVLQSIGWCQ